ncbi:CapA family protein [Citrifermentans bremense]|uniref:CapA family protein n=1 Tax=Citrifermentans bremense TaxID=60035 RepID=UPI00041E2D82|nr:CapA family protein [Citrifermentans bremense]
MQNPVSIFMCGDVMVGRGIDQILPHPVDPHLYEWFVTDARRYVDLAEKVSGPIPRPVPFDYLWGDAIEIFRRLRPDVKLINLETSVTTSEEFWPDKGINYRMHPRNFPAITAAGIDVCALANNHVMDWGYRGLEETLRTLKESGVRCAGAGLDLSSAAGPATVSVPGKGRVHVFSLGDASSGIPSEWGAGKEMAGVNLLPDLSDRTADRLRESVRQVKREGDLVVASIHWGGNWGFEIPPEQVAFAHRLIDSAGVDLIHGHSSHHVKGIEVYRGKLIIYGCGDFLTDYEGIRGKEAYHGDLGFMYFADVEGKTGELKELRLIPTRVRKFQVVRVSGADSRWLRDTMNLQGKGFGTHVEETEDQTLLLRWAQTVKG